MSGKFYIYITYFYAIELVFNNVIVFKVLFEGLGLLSKI